ncbi:2'-5' RNA ligase superfamily-domain containing protein [Nitzschia inconspicua]|uniref:2'-5' RNA ligase superfamily-domain containing protein n=1 Tax=Nitzschia inconspicua TaxID=303405 RepID=A0A9K3KE76_9STRA|nr:2'-5' RNA ligase superfamily-domain containing protein [Nitzschia inconspicua]
MPLLPPPRQKGNRKSLVLLNLLFILLNFSQHRFLKVESLMPQSVAYLGTYPQLCRHNQLPPSYSTNKRQRHPDGIPQVRLTRTLLHASRRDQTDFATSLAIVPNVEDWDRLQRARHFARDPIFQQWPPAVRLFHPFLKDSSAAFDVAQVVEDLELEPFEVTFDTWVILPNVEMQMELQNVQANPEVMGIEETAAQAQNRRELEESRQLIEEESYKSTMKNRSKKNPYQTDDNENDTIGETKRGRYKKHRSSPIEMMEEQQKIMDDDGGPCLLCLEPNEESKQKIIELRQALQEGLDLDPYSSPSSLYSWKYVKHVDMGYRPLIPISKFDSFQAALDVARRLKGLWGEPLTFEVKDLHMLSCRGEDENMGIKWDANSGGLGQSHPSALVSAEHVWGCNAKIMLLGEEVKQDLEANKKMVDRLVEEGEPGGMDISFDYTILDDEDESISGIEKWLDDDDDFDEGTQVIIGRTHFFTGDQRNYKGMPATSTVDTKDRLLGGVNRISGAARRRGGMSRQGPGWQDGEYGRRKWDYLSWGMQEGTSKENFASLPEEDGNA